MKAISRWAVAGAVGLWFTASDGRAQFEYGPEFQVNTYTNAGQQDPDTCVFDDGSFVIVWRSNGSDDGHASGVFGQRYSGSGAALGGEFQVNTYTLNSQFDPSVCCASNSFVVAWTSFQEDASSDGVFGQRFSTSGAFIGSQFQVNAYTAASQGEPDTCCQEDGRFVVVWRSGGPQDGDDYGIFGQAFASGGAPSGGEFQVNTYTTQDQDSPAVCCDGSGGFVVAWRSQAQDGSGSGVFGQGFSAPGVPDGAEFQVNNFTTLGQYRPDICCGPGGGFVVAWDSGDGQDGDSGGVFAQVFSAPGVEVGGEFQVNTYTPGFQGDPEICCDLEGFTVVWEDNSPPGDTEPIHGRAFDSLGVPLGAPYLVTDYPGSDADDPVVACAPNGDLLVAWETDSGDIPPRDGDDEGVFARLLFEPLTILEIPTLGGWGIGLLAAALAAGGAVFLRRR